MYDFMESLFAIAVIQSQISSYFLFNNSSSMSPRDCMYHQQQNKWYPQRCLPALFYP